MKFVSRLIPAVLLVLAFSGCYFDHPLTGGPTKDINTWLLGVWESEDDKGRLSRIMVTPMEEDRYAVHATLPGKKPKQIRKYEFEAWPSRVGDTVFLSLLCLESDGEIPPGAYLFAQVQLLDQNHARTRGLNLSSPTSATSFELRKEVRSKLKDRSLYEGAPSAVWSRVAEVFWSTDGSDPVFRPLRNPGRAVVSPNLKERDPSEQVIGNSTR